VNPCGAGNALEAKVWEAYLGRVFGHPVRLLSVQALGKDSAGDKSYGYGSPLRIECEGSGGRYRLVLQTVKPGPFGHEHVADRVHATLLAAATYNRLPRHVRTLGAGLLGPQRHPTPLDPDGEPFLLTEFVEGRPYAEDLERIVREGRLDAGDLPRADALSEYLAEIHQTPGPDPALYLRRLRELLGHGECIMGLTDSYPAAPGQPLAAVLEDIEHRALAWRWKLRAKTHRLRQVHGDFHPWNILFREATDFCVLDRSRGEWGEPADDVTCLTSNYLFFSLKRHGRLTGAFEVLFRRFWEHYLERSGDREILEAAAPFFAFRALVQASPVWYPTLPDPVRRRLLAFARNVLSRSFFEPSDVHALCEE
jgi:hypothetical protein